MTEIKFRGKRSWNDEWVYGNLVIDTHGRNHIVPFAYFDEDGHHLSYDDDTDKPVFIKQDSIGQFTGLHDKNGKEIYEGDICKIRFDVSKGEDYFYNSLTKEEQEAAERIFIVESRLFNNQKELNAEQIEIIGNVHEQQS